jgi:hypothetical protein
MYFDLRWEYEAQYYTSDHGRLKNGRFTRLNIKNKKMPSSGVKIESIVTPDEYIICRNIY